MFHVEIEKNDTETIVRPEGMIDSTTSDEFAKEMESMLLEKPASVILDFQKVDYISSAGFRILFMMAREMKKNQGQLTARHISAEIKNLFDMVHLDHVMTIEA